MITDIAKNTYQNITAEKLRLVQFLLRREQSLEQNDQQLSAYVKVRYSRRIFTIPLISRACLQSMHEMLGELHMFPGIFDSVVYNMTNVSRDIMEYVGCHGPPARFLLMNIR